MGLLANRFDLLSAATIAGVGFVTALPSAALYVVFLFAGRSAFPIGVAVCVTFAIARMSIPAYAGFRALSHHSGSLLYLRHWHRLLPPVHAVEMAALGAVAAAFL